jgi:hypothetical protein
MTLFVVALVLVSAIGYLAQTTGLCMVRGVNEAASGKPLFLLAILFSGAFSWISIAIALYMGSPVPFVSFEITTLAIVGGLLFGLGAAFNNGCGVSTISKLARGQMAMAATIIGWLVGWVLLSIFMPVQQPARYQIPPQWHYGALFLLSIIIALLITRFNKFYQKTWISILFIGAMASIVFLYEPKWTPSGLLKDVSLTLWTGEQSGWPSVERFMLMAALLGGMVIAALSTRAFNLSLAGWRVLSRHLTAGVLMGVGAAVASGGNDSQLLLGLPAFSPAGLATVWAMLGGIYLGRRLAF